MKRLLLAIAAAVMLVSQAHAAQNNLFLELQKNVVSYQGKEISLEGVRALLSGDICYNNVVVLTDLGSQAYTMLALREIVESCAGPQLLFSARFDMKSYSTTLLREPPCIYIGRSFFYDAMSSSEFWTEEYGPDSDPTIMLDGKRLYNDGAVTNIVAVIEKLKAKFGADEPVNLRIKVTAEATIGQLLEFDKSFTNEADVRGLKFNYAYFSGPNTTSSPLAFDLVWADFADIEVPTVDIADEAVTAPLFRGRDNIQAFAKYVESIYDYDIEKYFGAQGRVWVDFTVCVDGSVKDVVAVHGIEEVRECAVEAVKKAPPVWTMARDASGNPVNVRVHKVMVKILAHL